MAENLVHVLMKDHKEAKSLLERFDDLPVTARAENFCEMTHALVSHEVGEEEVLYPAVRKYVDGGDDLANARIGEQAEAETLLAKMEKSDPESVEFMTMFASLREAVLEHAEAEETLVFPALASSINADELEHLGKLYEQLKAVAPTHPHPHAPDTPPGNLLLGPVAGLVDRTRDAIRGVLK